MDVFVVELRGDEPVNRRRFVARVPADSMAFGSERVTDPTRSERVFGFLAVPSLDAVLVAGERAGVAADTFDLAADDLESTTGSRGSRNSPFAAVQCRSMRSCSRPTRMSAIRRGPY